MINKKVFQILSLSVLLLGLMYGCSDWLEYQPKDKQSEQQQFSQKSGFYATVNGVYNKMSGGALYGRYLSYELVDVLSQRYQVNQTDEDDHSRYLRALVSWNYSDDQVNYALESIWHEAYSTIMNINVIIKNIDDDASKGAESVLPQKEYNMLMGEMIAARAMIHFDLLRLFGPIYSKKPDGRGVPYNEDTKTEVLPLLPANVVLNDFIIRDLLLASNLLSESDPVLTDGPMPIYDAETMDNSMRYRQLRLNYYAVQLLLARAYLWGENYEKAVEYAQKLTDDTKVRAFFPSVDPGTLLANTVDPDRMFSTESLFGFYNRNRGLIYDNNFGGASTGRKLLIPRPNYVNGVLFSGSEASDYRYLSQWTTGNTLQGESSMQMIKFNEIIETSGGVAADDYNEETMLQSQKFHATFSSMMKLSEAYYIAAEVYGNPESGLTDLNKAWGYLNVIRQDRGLSSASGNNSTLTDRITKEYIREFIGEGQIFFYFKRLNKGFDNNYNGVKEIKRELVPGIPFFGYDYSDNADDATKELRFVAPLPSSELTYR